MKIYYRKTILLMIVGALCTAMAAAQQIFYKEQPVTITKERADHFDEKSLRERMTADGLPAAVVTKMVEQHRQMWAKGMHVEWNRAQNSTTRNGGGNHTCAICSDMSAENGWGAWQGAVGGNSSANPPVWGALGSPGAPNFNLMTGNGVDPCTPGFNPGDPPLPFVAPGFGNTSIELGESQTAGSITEQLVYPLTVAVTDTNFIYAYALVLEDAGHPNGERPYAEFVMLNPAGDTIPCAFFHYEAAEPNGTALPGFYQGTCGAKYKPWTTVGVNLSGYVGQTVTLVITNCDCIWGAHFAQSYWDFNCGILQGNSTADCYGVADTLEAPDDPSIVYGYHWYPGGQTTQNIVVYPQPGDTFTVEVLPPTGCSFYETFVPAVAGINPNFTYVATCGTVTFQDASSTTNGAAIVAWNWSFPGGNPSSSTQQNPVVHYATGNYTATLIVTTAHGCMDTVSIAGISPSAMPTAAFTGTSVCVGNATSFTDNSVQVGADAIVNWSWNFGDGSFSTLQNPMHIYGTAGNFLVTLSITSQLGCTGEVTDTVTVHPPPAANFTATMVCAGYGTVFTDLSTGNPVQWHWSFGDGGTSSIHQPAHTYPASGTYAAILIATNSFGCMDTVTHAVIVNPLPVPQFSSTRACIGDPNCFTDLSTVSTGANVAWEWDFGDTLSGALNTSTQQNPCHIFTPGATYTPVHLTVTSNNGCVSSIFHGILFFPQPVAAFNSALACIGDSTCFTDLSSVSVGSNVSWQWNFGDSLSGALNTSSLQNPCHIFTPGVFYNPVQLTVTSDSGCATSVNNTISFYPQPVPLFSSNKVCVGDATCFTDLSTIPAGTNVSWSWNFGDAASGSENVSGLQNPCHIFTPSGAFNPVQLIVTSNHGCSSDTAFSVLFWPLPAASFTSIPTCLNTLTYFTDESNPSDSDDPLHLWSWNFGDGSSGSSQQNPSHLYGSSGFFDVQLIVTTNHSCRDTITQPARVYALPSPEFSDSAQGCTPFCASFNDLSVPNDGTVAAWQWTFAGGSPYSTSDQNPEVCYSTPGSYNVTLVATTNYGCKDTLMKPWYVNVYELPKADFCVSPDSSVSLLTPAFKFCDLWTEDVTAWQWDYGDGSSIDSNIANPWHSYGSSIDNNTYYSYNVTVYVQTVHGCRDSIMRKVEVSPDFSFFVPNSFTPNGDQINDRFYGKGRGIKEYTITIYDRWGIELWTCHEDGLNTDWDRYVQEGMPSSCQWDGKLENDMAGRPAQNDVYVWRVRLTTIFDEVKTYIGHVSVVK